MKRINCLDDFIQVTGYNRGNKYPDVKVLRAKLTELKIKGELRIDVMSYFLYDNKSR